MSSLNALFQQGTEEGLIIDDETFLLQREEDLLVKDLMPHVEKSMEDKEKINKELLDSFLKKEKELLNTNKKTLLTNKKLSETISCLNKLSEQAKYVLNLNVLKKKPKFIIDI